jgi:hypothetical protein
MHRLADWLFLANGLACFAALAIHFHRSQSAGPTLLDIRNRDSRRYGFGIVALVTGLFYIFFPRLRFQGLYWLGYGSLAIVASARSFQIREAGVLTRRLFRWEDIREYYLSRSGSLSLNLRGTGWTGAGGVPREHRQRVDELLSSRLPAQRVIYDL